MADGYPANDIPEGIAFSDKVLIVPDLYSGFTHSGHVSAPLEGKNYSWVRRGQPIGAFEISGSRSPGFLSALISQETATATVRSPASGLLLSTRFDTSFSQSLEALQTQDDPPISAFTLLLPIDEPAPENGEYLYGDVCRTARDFEHYYLKDSRYWSMNGFDKSAFDDMLRKQCAFRCRTFDAMPRYADYFDEARTRRPYLRPNLSHLR